MLTAMELNRLRAVNTAPDSENRMHDDGVAARYGFRGGLVPGVTVYGYMADPLGAAFLESGGMSLRLQAPFYDGDEVIIEQEGMVVTARGVEGQVRAAGTLCTLPAPPQALIPEASLPPERPPASAKSLAPGTVLGSLRLPIETPTAEKLLELSNRILMQNVTLEPWIHAGSEIQHFRSLRAGDDVTVTARVIDNFEKRGRLFVVYDVQVLNSSAELVQHVRHTAIYRLSIVS